ncbi:MAG TPA: PDZ domain-containing protein [Polyangiaceae bacterium]|jgi:S1-C subfamily serine protease
MRGIFWLISVCALGCGGAAETAPPALAPQLKPTPVVAVPAPKPPSGALFREDVDALIDQGFARFLSRVDVQPRLVAGQFRGWSIVNLQPSDFWAGVDLKPGDVVTKVNDLPIERDTEAYDAFESLKQADKLTVLFERDGKSQRLEYRIVPRPVRSASN